MVAGVCYVILYLHPAPAVTEADPSRRGLTLWPLCLLWRTAAKKECGWCHSSHEAFVEVGSKVNPVLVPVSVCVWASCSSITVKGGAECDLASSLIWAGGCCCLGLRTESALAKHSIPFIFLSIVWSFSCWRCFPQARYSFLNRS